MINHRRSPLPRRTRPRAALVAVAAGLLATACANEDAPRAGEARPDAPDASDPAAAGPTNAPPPTTTPAAESTPSAGRPPLPRTAPTGPVVDRRVETLPPDFEPVVWADPPPRPALEGPLAVNSSLTEADVVGEAELAGPEDVTPGLDGHLYTGTADGAVWRLVLDPAGRIERFEQIAAVAGRVLGLDAYSETTLVAAVAEVGLIAIDTTTAETWVLADRLDGNLIFFADAVAVADDGTIYVTEASTVYLPGFPNDFLDGRPNGRLLRYEPSTGAIDVVADGLHFANGIDVAADESYALVAESFRFRILRVWLHGDRAGTTEPFGPPLVNGPDNLRLDDRGRVWIGGSDLRSDATDAALTNPDVRRSIAALTDEERAAIRSPYGFAQVLDPDGEPIVSFHDTTGRYFAVSCVLLHDDMITFGTLADRGLAQLPLPPELA